MDDEDLEVMRIIFLMFDVNFAKIYFASGLRESLTNEEHEKLLEIVRQSVSQTKKDIMDEFNKEEIEGENKYA